MNKEPEMSNEEIESKITELMNQIKDPFMMRVLLAKALSSLGDIALSNDTPEARAAFDDVWNRIINPK